MDASTTAGAGPGTVTEDSLLGNAEHRVVLAEGVATALGLQPAQVQIIKIGNTKIQYLSESEARSRPRKLEQVASGSGNVVVDFLLRVEEGNGNSNSGADALVAKAKATVMSVFNEAIATAAEVT
jgi:hypothetical protein